MLKMRYAIILLIVGAVVLFYNVVINWGAHTEYDLLIGYQASTEFAEIVDPNTEFINDRRLIANSEILQQTDMRETADLAAFELALNNLKWPKGEYTVFFKRGLEIEKSLDIILK
ncbi:hypothetical protein D3C74_122010 [compost metagenome]